MGTALKEGELARHKLGGPLLTVFHIFGGLAYCRWLIGRELGGGVFPLADLAPAPQPISAESASDGDR